MPIIDDEGRLLGTINVIDALVVVLVCTAVLAGVALVIGGDGGSGDGPTGSNETRYVTLDFGTQPNFIVDQLEEGDTADVEDRFGNLRITHLYFAPSNDSARAIARVAVTSRVTGDRFTFDGAPLRFGRTLAFETSTYNVTGEIRELGSGRDLETGRTPVVLRGTVPNTGAATLERGDEVRISGRTTAVIEDVVAYDTGNPTGKAVFLVANLSTYRTDDAVRYGDTRLQPGQSIALPVEGYRFTGAIERLGDSLQRTSERVLVTDVVETDVARSISAGDAYRVSGDPVGTVESVTVYGTNDPDRKRIYVGLELDALGYGERVRFGDTVLRQGATVTFNSSEYSFDGTVTRTGALEQRGTESTRTVTLELRNVSPDRADDVRQGMAEVNGNRTVARLTDVETEPATIVLTSTDGQIYARDHPVNKELTITADLSVRETATGTLFKGRRLRVGDTVTLDLGSTTIEANVVAVEE